MCAHACLWINCEHAPVCACFRMHKCTYQHTHTHTHTCTCWCTHMHTHVFATQTLSHTFVCVHENASVCMHSHGCTCTCACNAHRACVCVHKCTCTHTHMQMSMCELSCVHMHAHVKHVHTWSRNSSHRLIAKHLKLAATSWCFLGSPWARRPTSRHIVAFGGLIGYPSMDLVFPLNHDGSLP